LKKLLTIILVILMCGAAFGAAPTLKIRTLKLLVVIYRGEEGSSQYIDDKSLEGLKKGLELGRLFYFRNSGCRLNLDFNYMVINTIAPDNTGPTYDNIVKDLRSRGVKDNQYDGIYSTGLNFSGNFGGFQVFGKTGASFSGAQRGGPLGTFPGKDPDTWYDEGWFFVHEFQHALDSPICELSGHPEMLSDHPYSDSWAKYFTYGHHAGQHWDWVAHCLSSFKDYLGVEGVTNTIYEVVDADGDGLPDDDPRLPMDEKRFGSDPTKKDTDGDGLNDLKEFTADIYWGSNPRKKDTDGDGMPDGKDLNPTVALAPTVAYSDKNPIVDGKLDACYKQLTFGTYMDNSPELAAARMYACWNEDSLSLFVKSKVKCNLGLYVDTSAKNGFWEGGDTYLINVKPDGTVEFSGLGLSGPVPGAKAAWGADGLEVTIPALIGQGVSGEINFGGKRRPEDTTDGMVLLDGRWISFNLILDANGSRALITPQWCMFDTKLVKSPTDPPRPSLRFTPTILNPKKSVVKVTGVGPKDIVTIVDAAGKVLGKRTGSGEVDLTGKIKSGSNEKSGANTIYAVSKGRKSAPKTVILDTLSEAPKIEYEAGTNAIKITGESYARVDLFATNSELQRPRAVATVMLDKNGKGTFDVSAIKQGFIGGYAEGMAFERTTFWRNDREIKFDYQDGTPDPRLPSEGFCVRWLGFINIPKPGTYTFYLSSDDGARLWIRQKLIADNWGHHDLKEVAGTAVLEEGEYPIRVDYFEEFGWAAVHLEWSGPGIERTHSLPVTPLPSSISAAVIYAKQIDKAGNFSNFSEKISVPL